MRRADRSDAKRGIVDKLQYAFTVTWQVTAVLKGASYKLEHSNNNKKIEKKHASDLSPYPAKLIPFQQVNGADTKKDQFTSPSLLIHSRKQALRDFLQFSLCY